MNHYHKNFLPSFIILSVGLFLFSCKKESIDTVTGPMNYFPSQKGYWVEYEVDSVYHADNDNNNDDSVYSYHYQIREEIDSTYIDAEGKPCNVIIRMKRLSETTDWELIAVGVQSVNDFGAFRVEDNRRYQKLAFPIRDGLKWNGNAYNNLVEEEYSYTALHVPFANSNISVDSSIIVQQIDEDNYIERIFGKEIYASEVGLVFKQKDELQKRNGIVVRGLEYKMQAIRYGH